MRSTKSTNLELFRVRVKVWCLTQFSTIFSHVMAVSFIGGENHRPVESH